VTQVTAVGQVRSFNAAPTHISIRIDDGTGTLEVKKFTDIDKQNETANPDFEVDSHVRIWGRLKSFGGKRHVSAHLIRPITDHNEVNYHMLEATYVHLYFTKGPNPGQTGGDGDSMFVDGGAGYSGGGDNSATSSKLSGCSQHAKKMHNFMNETPGGNEGIHLNNITTRTGMSVRDVLTAADELLGQGLIYTTVDDETWAILEY
jgi:replication factor A2